MRLNIFFKYLVLVLLLSAPFLSLAQVEDSEDSEEEGLVIKGAIALEDVDSIMKMYSYDPITDRYIYSVTAGGFDIEYPIILTRKQYEEILLNAATREFYYKQLAAAEDRLSEEEMKDMLPGYYVNSKLFESIFGSNTIDVRPNGSVEVEDRKSTRLNSSHVRIS